MATNLQIQSNMSSTPQYVQDGSANNSVLAISNGTIGIGTNNAPELLSLQGSGSAMSTRTGGGTITTKVGTDSSDGRVLLYASGSAAVDIKANGVSYLSGGNVGFGTTNPGQKVTVAGGSLLVRTTNDLYDAIKLLAGASSGELSCFNTGTQTVAIRANDSYASYIQTGTAGYVGIGTSSPVAKLHVNGRILIASGNAPGSAVGASGDKAGMTAWDTSYLYVCTADYDGSTHVWKRTSLSSY